jgi:hypothetical protein
MDKLDLRKELKHLYSPSAKKVEIVDVPKLKFVMIDGRIGPGEAPATSAAFQEAMGALYGAAYTLKFISKLREKDPIDYTVMALEGLWWGDSGGFDFGRKEPWNWTVMVVQPDHVTKAMFEEALAQLRRKRDSPSISRLRLESFREGLSMQVMHVGPYSEEARTIERMTVFAKESGLTHRGKHHEIYMGDPRRAKPEKLKTILRQPVARAR